MLVTIFLCLMNCVNGQEYILRDQQNDVYYLPGDGSNTQMDISTQPNIDIVNVKYEIDENTVSISIKVVGKILDSSNQVLYYGEYESADALYQFTFSNNNVNAMVDAGGSKLPVEASTQVTDDTLTVIFDLATDDTSLSNLYAYGHYYEDSEELMLGAKYIDTTADIENVDPSDNSNNQNSANGQSQEKGTPGFEVIILITALAIVFILAYGKDKK